MATTDSGLPPGERIRLYRRRAGLTQEQCAQLKGCTVSTWRKWESGERQVAALTDWIEVARILRIRDLYLLTGLPVGDVPDAPAEHAAVPPIRAAMVAFAPQSPGEPNPPRLAGAVDEAWTLWQERRPFLQVGGLLPGLITEVRATIPQVGGADRERVLPVAAMLYFLTRAFTKRVGAQDLSLLAADRALAAAVKMDSLDFRAAAAWNIGMTLADQGHPDVVAALARDAAAELEPTLSNAQPDRISVYGTLHLLRATQLARLGDEHGAYGALEAADKVAAGIGDRNDFRTFFGPTNVAIHRLQVALAMSRPAEALRHAQRYEVGAVPNVERRFSHYVYLARAYGMRNEDVAAMHMLLCAERESPDDLRYNLDVRAVVRDLLRREKPMIRTELRPLAERIGILR
jgi:transcriptional regulator with XRE-family HTH domain